MIEAHDTWAREIAKAGIDCNKADGDEDKRRCNDPRKADLSGADLSEANLCGKDLRYANLTGADLSDSDLSRTNLTGARLVATDLENANMTDANLAEADLSCALYEPKSGGPEIRGPTPAGLATADNLCRLTYHDSPHGLLALRKTLRELGDRDRERMLTFAIRYEERLRDSEKARERTPLTRAYEKTLERKGIEKRVGAMFDYWAFEWTCDYGMSPGRPLLLLFLFMLLFTIPYTVALWRFDENSGIFEVPSKDRDAIAAEPPPHLLGRGRGTHWFKLVRQALWFSVISAFQIGWREINQIGRAHV